MTETVTAADLSARFSSMCLDNDGNPHISYRDRQSDTLCYAHKLGSTWSIETVDVGGNGWENAIAVGPDGNVHIAYYEYATKRLKYAKFNGSEWTISVVDTPSAKADDFHSVSLVVDQDGQAHIAYSRYANGGVYFASWNGSAWVKEEVDAWADGLNCSLALDSQGRARIVYTGYYQGRANYLMFASRSDASWTREVVSYNGLDQRAWAVSLAVAPDDTFHISYSHGELVKHASLDGSTWLIDACAPHTAYSTSIKVDSNGIPHVAYARATELNYTSAVPEPTSLLAFSAGVAALALRKRIA